RNVQMVRTTEIPDRPGQCSDLTAAERDPADRDGEHSFERPCRASQEDGLTGLDLLWWRCVHPSSMPGPARKWRSSGRVLEEPVPSRRAVSERIGERHTGDSARSVAHAGRAPWYGLPGAGEAAREAGD